MRPAMLRTVGVVFTLIAAPVLSSAQVPAELLAYPNLVIVNAKVLTVDQQFTVAEAVAMGSSLLVMGRAITSASDPREALESARAERDEAAAKKPR